MTPFENEHFDNHEQIIFCSDKASGLRGIIAIHSTRLGPAAGGCRMYPYESTEAALTDALRLSRGMSYKNALAGLQLGGGKSVIIGNPRSSDKPEILRAFGRHIQSLQGRYWSAIDVGISAADVAIMNEETEFVFSLVDPARGRQDTALSTALGGFVSIKACVKHRLGKEDLSGVKVAVQGVGKTGMDICRQLAEEGAVIVVSDINENAVVEAAQKYGASAVSPDKIYEQQVDVFVPCAMGAIINDETLPKLKASIVCGLANNQLAENRHGRALMERNILYAPDYVVNAGGMLYASDDIFGINDPAQSEQKIRNIYNTLLGIFARAEKENLPTSEIADKMALTVMENGRTEDQLLETIG
ncbi:MAG: Leu/Phe/Val dehydrogenase [Methyloligellaceae bacterium]